MAINLTTNEIIASALQLPLVEREKIYDALQESLIDESVDHGPAESADAVEAAWSEEVSRRVEDIDSGRVETIPSEEAWKIINGKNSPGF